MNWAVEHLKKTREQQAANKVIFETRHANAGKEHPSVKEGIQYKGYMEGLLTEADNCAISIQSIDNILEAQARNEELEKAVEDKDMRLAFEKALPVDVIRTAQIDKVCDMALDPDACLEYCRTALRVIQNINAARPPCGDKCPKDIDCDDFAINMEPCHNALPKK